jgi:hypothetical protein
MDQILRVYHAVLFIRNAHFMHGSFNISFLGGNVGKKSRLKKIRKELGVTLKAQGIENQVYMVVSKTKLAHELVVDDKGQPVMNADGKPQLKQVRLESYTAKNPQKSLVRKLMREDTKTIKEFIRSFDRRGSDEPTSKS